MVVADRIMTIVRGDWATAADDSVYFLMGIVQSRSPASTVVGVPEIHER